MPEAPISREAKDVFHSQVARDLDRVVGTTVIDNQNFDLVHTFDFTGNVPQHRGQRRLFI